MKFLYAFIAVCLLWGGNVRADEDAGAAADNSEMAKFQRELDRLMAQTQNRTPVPEQTAMPPAGDPLPFVAEEDLNFPDDEFEAGGEASPDDGTIETFAPETKSGDGSLPTFPVQSPVFMPGSGTPPAKNADKPAAKSLDGESLSDTLQSQEKEKLPIPIPNVRGTWVDKLTSSVTSSLNKDSAEEEEELSNNPEIGGGETLDGMVKKSQSSAKRSNASVFDVSGIMLRMNLTQVEKAMLSRGFKKISQKLEIPNFIKWRNEEKCRGNGVVGFERLSNCVVEISKKANHQYVETAKYANFKTKEEVSVNFTSNFTNNKVYRVMYKSISPRVTGSGQKAQYLRNIKVYDFWRRINQKYGAPDNKDEVTWGLGGNSPYLKASTGFLVLEDPMLRELDFTRMSREDQRFLHTDLYNF